MSMHGILPTPSSALLCSPPLFSLSKILFLLSPSPLHLHTYLKCSSAVRCSALLPRPSHLISTCLSVLSVFRKKKKTQKLLYNDKKRPGDSFLFLFKKMQQINYSYKKRQGTITKSPDKPIKEVGHAMAWKKQLPSPAKKNNTVNAS